MVEVPRQSGLRPRRDIVGVALQLVEIVECVDAVDLTGGNQAHEEITNLGATLGAKEESLPAMDDRSFECVVGDVVVQRRTGLAHEQRQRVPTLEHVVDRFAER